MWELPVFFTLKAWAVFCWLIGMITAFIGSFYAKLAIGYVLINGEILKEECAFFSYKPFNYYKEMVNLIITD